jgi:hypothetical protein
VGIVGLTYGGLAVLGFADLLGRRRRASLFLAVLIGVPFIVAAWLAATNVKVWNPRYVAVAFPAFLLCAGHGLARTRGGLREALLVVAVALGLLGVWNLHRNPAYAKEDYRSAGRYLDQELADRDALVGVGAPGPIFFYLARQPSAYLLVHPHRIGDDEELRRRLKQISAGRAHVWLLRARTYQSDPANRVGAILGETRTRAERRSYHGVEIERFDVPGDSAASGVEPHAAGGG